jgi:predicted nuclease of predicted toxin-antitoxin system
MKLLLDEAVPYSAASLLAEIGIEAAHVIDIGYASFKDEAIIEKAREEGWVIVTYDADFHALVALSGEQHPSVIRIRIEGLKGEMVRELLKEVIERSDDLLELGVLVTVQQDRMRMKRLPILRGKA